MKNSRKDDDPDEVFHRLALAQLVGALGILTARDRIAHASVGLDIPILEIVHHTQVSIAKGF